MIEALVTRLDADRTRTWMIGDGAADVQAGRAASVRTALVFASNRCELCPLRHGPTRLPEPSAGSRGSWELEGLAPRMSSLAPDVHGASLAEVAEGILRAGATCVGAC